MAINNHRKPKKHTKKGKQSHFIIVPQIQYYLQFSILKQTEYTESRASSVNPFRGFWKSQLKMFYIQGWRDIWVMHK